MPTIPHLVRTLLLRTPYETLAFCLTAEVAYYLSAWYIYKNNNKALRYSLQAIFCDSIVVNVTQWFGVMILKTLVWSL
jgi:hypothetical protein